MMRSSIEQMCREALAELPSRFAEKDIHRSATVHGLSYNTLKDKVNRAISLGHIRRGINEYEKI